MLSNKFFLSLLSKNQSEEINQQCRLLILILGVTGSGKSTQGRLLINRGKVEWLSIGELLRKKIKDDRLTQISDGIIINDNDVINILNDEIRTTKPNKIIILDGFPRTQYQTKWLQKQANLRISAIIQLLADDTIVTSRLLLRGRHDDNPLSIKRRISIFKKNNKSIIKSFKNTGTPIININADQTPEKMHRDIVKELKCIGIKV